jgi:hypothetical protein
LDDYHGEILECVNCFLPDHAYRTSNLGGYGEIFQGGIKYGDLPNYDPSHSYYKDHQFSVDIKFAFTPLPATYEAVFNRTCEITHDSDFYPNVDPSDIYTYSDYWDENFQNNVRPIWEANARAAYLRGGTHGFTVMADYNWEPEYDGQTSNSVFLDYLEIFDWIPLGHEQKRFTNADSKKFLSYSTQHTIIPKMSTVNACVYKYIVHSPEYGSDWFPADFSAYECNFDGTPDKISPPAFPFVFWVYDYSNHLGITLQNLEEHVEMGSNTTTRVFPMGYIPHEDATGSQNSVWAYRWISNEWKYAPWARYPNL